MEYEFSRNDSQQFLASTSSGHEAIGTFITEEVAANSKVITTLLAIIDDLQGRKIYHQQWEGRSFTLSLDRDQAEVTAHVLEQDQDDDLYDNMGFYDSELHAECGLLDFQELLLAWREFIEP